MCEERLVEIYCHGIVVLCDYIQIWCFGWLLDLLATRNSYDYNSLFHTVCLQFTTAHTESSHSTVLHQSSGTGFQRRMFPFLHSQTGPVQQAQQLLTHSALANSILKALLLSLVTGRCFGRTYCLHIQGRRHAKKGITRRMM
jgi:hypothetical protein